MKKTINELAKQAIKETFPFLEEVADLSDEDITVYTKFAELLQANSDAVDERTAFEEWVKQGKQFYLKVDSFGEYINHETRMQWIGFQARASLANKPDSRLIDNVCLKAAEIHCLGNYVSDEEAQSIINEIRDMLETAITKG